jgi:PncC family amidohydrolase
MSDHVSASDDDGGMAEALGRLLLDRGRWIGVAESLTGGLLVQALARVQGSGDWLAGGVVAYAPAVKRDLLGVTADKVVSRESAKQMASGARQRLGADIAVSVTGVAGPDPQDGEPPGTVWIGLDDGSSVTAELFITSGSASEVCAHTVSEALRRVVGALRPV